MKQVLFASMMITLFAAAGVSFAGSDPCLDCHEKNTPGIVQYWGKSAHFRVKLTCAGCHGEDIDANHNRTVSVDAAKCGSCHKTALSDHLQSRHGRGLTAGRGCTRNQKRTEEQQKSCVLCHKPDTAGPRIVIECAMFLAQSPEMQRRGCTSCHLVETRCDTCHTKHSTDLDLARDPAVCGTCHMGPDHPQMEMWETSRHGVLNRRGGEQSGPSCITCHMTSGSHNVSKGISSGLPDDATEDKKRERAFMIAICSECHTRSLSARNLNDADKIKEQSLDLVREARGIIEGLQRDGLLSPSPLERPPHPLFGKSFVIGPHMLYEGLSFVESLFFKMKAFYAVTAYKGVFHQNPDYAHWYGNAPLKLTLSEIKSEAALLRKVDQLRKRLDNFSPVPGDDAEEFEDIKTELRMLNERRLRKELSERDFREKKKKLLDNSGL